MDSFAALQILARTHGLWSEFNVDTIAKPRLFAGKRQRLAASSAREVLAALEALGLDARSLAVGQRDYLLGASAFIDAQIDYQAPTPSTSSPDNASDIAQAGKCLPSCYRTPAVRERFHELSVADDRKKKGPRLWLDFETLEHMADPAYDQPWRTDLSQRAHYLRAQNCLMQALGTCSFNPLEVVAFNRSQAAWSDAHDCQWIKDHPLPHLTQTLASLCQSENGDLENVTKDFIMSWTAYQSEVQQVYSLWKGWKGPRAHRIAEHDFGLDMLASYARLFEYCGRIEQSVMQANEVIAAFNRISGSYRHPSAFGNAFSFTLDPVSPQEHERRSIQSEAARAKTGNRSPEWLSSNRNPYIEDEPYHAIGTLDDYFSNRWRYSSDFFDAVPPWERSSYPTDHDSRS